MYKRWWQHMRLSVERLKEIAEDVARHSEKYNIPTVKKRKKKKKADK